MSLTNAMQDEDEDEDVEMGEGKPFSLISPECLGVNLYEIADAIGGIILTSLMQQWYTITCAHSRLSRTNEQTIE